MRKAVRPVRQLLVGALATVADERDPIAEPLLDDPIGQLDCGVEIFGILKLRPVEKQFRPLLERRKISPRKIINVTRWAKAHNSTRHFHRPSLLRDQRLLDQYPGRPEAPYCQTFYT